jgi:hypothetical protein
VPAAAAPHAKVKAEETSCAFLILSVPWYGCDYSAIIDAKLSFQRQFNDFSIGVFPSPMHCAGSLIIQDEDVECVTQSVIWLLSNSGYWLK